MSDKNSSTSKLFASQLAEKVEATVSFPGHYDKTSQLWVSQDRNPLAGMSFRFTPTGGPSQMIIQTGGGATNIISPDTIPSVSDPIPDQPQMDGSID